jgi:hypothetical protein
MYVRIAPLFLRIRQGEGCCRSAPPVFWLNKKVRSETPWIIIQLKGKNSFLTDRASGARSQRH